jgi:hypothetical protein
VVAVAEQIMVADKLEQQEAQAVVAEMEIIVEVLEH